MTHLRAADPRFDRLVETEPMRRRTTGYRFTEGPVWHGDENVLIFSDIPGDCLYRLDPATDRVTEYRRPSSKTNGNVFDREHRLISCEHATSRVVRAEADGSLTVIASHYGGIELNSPNDVVVDRRGRIYFTDPPYGRYRGEGALLGVGIPRPLLQPVRGVYRVDPTDGSIARIADDFEEPNGLCFAEDERVLFIIDSARNHIRRFEVRGDQVTGGEVWAETVGEGEGVPDGMKIDAEGNLYCCGPGGVQVFDPEGTLLGTILTPEVCANFNWGDADRRTLYLCSTSSVYSCRTKVPGPVDW